MKVTARPVGELRVDPDNARTRDASAVDAIARSLDKFGQQKPIVVAPDGTILAGNGTYAAAMSLGWAKIDCVTTDLQGTEARAFAIADNRTAELAAWDDEALLAALEAAESAGVADATGFSADEIAALRGALSDAAMDEMSERAFRDVDTEGQDVRNDDEADAEGFASEDAAWRVIVSCATEADASEVVAAVTGQGLGEARVIEL